MTASLAVAAVEDWCLGMYIRAPPTAGGPTLEEGEVENSVLDKTATSGKDADAEPLKMVLVATMQMSEVRCMPMLPHLQCALPPDRDVGRGRRASSRRK
jgi:hypothetical protein